MRNYNHYIRFINNGVKVIFEENKYGSTYGINIYTNNDKYECYDYFEMEGDLYYCSLTEYKKNGIKYSYFELYKAIKFDDGKFEAIGNKVYCTDPEEGVEAFFKNLKKYVNKCVKIRTGYDAIFYIKSGGSKIAFSDIAGGPR